MRSRCRGNMSHDQEERSKSECVKGDCAKGACEPFRRLGTVSDYAGLLDAVVKFRAWKEAVLKPIVADLGGSLHTLKATNHLLHELAELITTSVSTSDLDDTVCNIESQLQMLGCHMDVLRHAPSKLLKFKEKTMHRMTTLKNKCATTMRQMHEVVHPSRPRRQTPPPVPTPRPRRIHRHLPMRPRYVPYNFVFQQHRSHATPRTRSHDKRRLKKKHHKHRTKSHKKRKRRRHHKHKSK